MVKDKIIQIIGETLERISIQNMEVPRLRITSKD